MLIIIDGDSLLYPIVNPIKKEDGTIVDKTHHQLIESTDSLFKTIIKATKPDEYIGYLSFGDNNKYRKAYNLEYKSNRKAKEVNPILYSNINFVKEYLFSKYNFNKVYDIETDDMVSITARRLSGLIVGEDKDYLTVPCQFYNWKKKVYHSISKEQAIINLCKSLIIGDRADNITGLHGKGEKYIEKNVNLKGDKNDFVTIFSEYLKYFNDYSQAIDEFYKNFKCLKVLDDDSSMELPSPVKLFTNEVNNNFNY